MGGYPTKDGKRVKYGLLYRSDQFFNLNNISLNYVKSLKINTIVDYRSNVELVKYPNKYIGEKISFHLDPAAETAELAAQFQAKKENEDIELIKIAAKEAEKSPNEGENKMHTQYLRFVNNSPCQNAYKKMLELLTNIDNAPLVQHCRGGKDRTGYGCMLLLLALGVDESYVVRDYMITAGVRKKRNETKLSKYKKYTNDPVILDYLMALIEAREEFLKTSIDEINKSYGGINQYLKNVFLLKDEDFKKLKEYYLE